MYYNKEIEQSRHNSGLLWKNINSIIKLKKSRTSNEILQLKDNENGIIENLHDISNEFTNYFSSLEKIWQIN